MANGGGLLGGGNFNDRVAQIVVKVFDNYDIEPGELNQNINDAVTLVKEFAPIMREMGELADEMDNDVNKMREDISEFNRNVQQFSKQSDELADALERTADSFEKFNQLIEQAAKEENNG